MQVVTRDQLGILSRSEIQRILGCHLEFEESNWRALEEVGLVPLNCHSVAEGIRELIKQRDSLKHELRRIKGIADAVLR